MRFCGSIRGMGIAAFAGRRRRTIVCCHRMHATEGKDALSSLHLAEEKAQLFSRLSEALFADEAAALSLRLPDTSECEVSGAVNEAEALEAPSSAEHCMEVALSPPPLLSSSKGNEGHAEEGPRADGRCAIVCHRLHLFLAPWMSFPFTFTGVSFRQPWQRRCVLLCQVTLPS
ncbi:hypothetical protein C4B63_8g501 [Trypanosoma cruzi]|uniref:Uncharacterized protein n=1 Tax=Trypanosoma cruzi TaxID=5693 RepID=A0A2V2VWX5_TRYCR|nr:hypothetical protein C4B63_8g501 [Trypanosoma cruzi]